MRTLRLFLLIGLSAIPYVREARAQPATDVETLYREGIALMKQGKDAEAEAKLQQSWDLRRTVDTATNLGELELDLGQEVEAATHLDYAERHMPNSLSPAIKKRIADLAQKARGRVGALAIEVTPADAMLSLDSRELGRSLEGPVFVVPGEHVVAAAVTGYAPLEQRARVDAGQTERLQLVLQAVSAPPIVLPPVEPEQPPVTPPPVERDEGAPVAAWVTLGAGATIAVVGGVLLGVGLASQGGVEDDAAAIVVDGGRCEPASTGFDSRCDDLVSSADSANALTGAGAVGLGVGGGIAVVGLVWLLTSAGGGDETTAVRVLPVTSSSAAGLVALGRF